MQTKNILVTSVAERQNLSVKGRCGTKFTCPLEKVNFDVVRSDGMLYCDIRNKASDAGTSFHQNFFDPIGEASEIVLYRNSSRHSFVPFPPTGALFSQGISLSAAEPFPKVFISCELEEFLRHTREVIDACSIAKREDSDNEFLG
ncbi:hypothetical protein MarSH_160 [Marseillevirus Shanghai 1]|nr:hypothetical protein MarSH_160 [Marseillevirus Shanghai 1]